MNTSEKKRFENESNENGELDNENIPLDDNFKGSEDDDSSDFLNNNSDDFDDLPF